MKRNLVAFVAAAHQLAFEEKLQSFQLATGLVNVFAPAGQAVAAQQEAVAQRVGLGIIINTRRQSVDIWSLSKMATGTVSRWLCCPVRVFCIS